MSLRAVSSRLSSSRFSQALIVAGRELSSKRVVGEAGSGMVRATLGGDGRIVDLQVNPCIGKEGSRAIADLVRAAVNRAHDRLREETREIVQGQLPPNVEPSIFVRSVM